MKKFLIYILLILLVFPKYAYSIRIMGVDTTSPMGNQIVHGALSVLYVGLFLVDGCVNDIRMQGVMIAGGVGTFLEFVFRKIFIDNRNHRPGTETVLKIFQSAVGYGGGKAAENGWVWRSEKKGFSSSIIIKESLEHAIKGGAKSIVKNVPLVYVSIIQLNGFAGTITLSVVGEALATGVKNRIQGKETQIEDLAKSVVSSGVVRSLANMGGETVVGWKQDPWVGIFSELMVDSTKRLLGEGTKKFPELIDQQDISEIPQPLNSLKTSNFILDEDGSLQPLTSQFLPTAEPDALFETDFTPSSFTSYRILRIYDVAYREEGSSGGTKFVRDVSERGKCFYPPLIMLLDTNTSQLISPDKFPLDLKHEDKGVRSGL